MLHLHCRPARIALLPPGRAHECGPFEKTLSHKDEHCLTRLDRLEQPSLDRATSAASGQPSAGNRTQAHRGCTEPCLETNRSHLESRLGNCICRYPECWSQPGVGFLLRVAEDLCTGAYFRARSPLAKR